MGESIVSAGEDWPDAYRYTPLDPEHSLGAVVLQEQPTMPAQFEGKLLAARSRDGSRYCFCALCILYFIFGRLRVVSVSLARTSLVK